MRRIPYIPLFVTLMSICLGAQASVTVATAAATASPAINKAALDKAVQEALAKQSGQAGGGSQASLGAAAAGLGAGTGAAAQPGAGATSGQGLGTSGSFSNLTEGGEEASTPTVPTASTSSSSSGVSSSVLLPLFIVGAVLLGGIAFFIVRDARNVAPVGDSLGGAGSAQERAARLRKRRAKAKAARRQRKRNR